MNINSLEVKAALQISKPPEAVFEAIIDPEKMKNYFISKSSGNMKEDEAITWKFPEFDETFNIHVKKVEPPRYISFYWGRKRRCCLWR